MEWHERLADSPWLPMDYSFDLVSAHNKANIEANEVTEVF